VPPHTANPLYAELFTAAVGRPRLPGGTVYSNASVNQRLLLHQRAGETTATCWLSVIHRCDVINGNLSVQSHTSDKWWAAANALARESQGGGNDGQVHGRDTSVIGSWLQCGRLQLVAETDMLQCTFTDTDTGHLLLSQVKWRDIRHSLRGPLSLYRLARCEVGDLMR